MPQEAERKSVMITLLTVPKQIDWFGDLFRVPD